MKSASVVLAASCVLGSVAPVPAAEGVRAAVERRLIGDRTGACLAVAVVDKESVAREYVCADPAARRAIGADTAFEIGSVTKTDEVLYFRAEDKYTQVVTATGDAVIRTPLKELLAQIDPEVFWQVHRSVIVRVSAIAEVRKDELGRFGLSLKGRTETLPVSGSFHHRFRGM
jgi:hypothetical protein